MMLDEDWESAMGELEVAAVSCEGFLPPQAMQGLVDLFAYEEPIPSCEWKAGSRSLRRLSRNLENVISRLGEGEVVNSLLRAAEAFRDAGQLFTGSFKMPPDPRIYRGPRGQTPRDFYGSFYQPPEPQYVEDAPPGSPAGQLLQSVAAELEAETTSEGRRLLLRRLVRKLHPDQNRGKDGGNRGKDGAEVGGLMLTEIDKLTQVEGGKKVEEQSDEKDMGMSYDELGDLGHLRKVEKCGPLSTFLKLRQLWSHKTADWTGPQDNDKAITPSIRVKVQPQSFDEKVAQKVKDFYFYNAINRHKMTTLTPSYHAENYSPDDNRFDLRPFLFPAAFEAQFEAIDEVVKACKGS
ncbi:unnamed protein product [Durusdinium trenchii]|uniref:Uncharacterized protein n=1 Tax=Durusdinium trenchii TaxID=1381693 RepID=A0ABP0QQD6_9DINO